MIFTKNPEKFYEKIVKRRLKKTNFHLLTQALEEVFPNRWDLNLTGASTFIGYHKLVPNIKAYVEGYSLQYAFVIHYPSITIRNYRGQKREITDLYVFIDVEDYIRFKRVFINGLRASATPEEINSNYGHSHLSGRLYLKGDFCLGMGPLNREKDQIHKYETVDEYKYFLSLITEYLKWESIGGGPYKRMEDVVSGNLPNISYSNITKISKNLNLKDINFKIDDSKIEIIPDAKFENLVFDYVKSKSYNSLLCYKTSTGKYIGNVKADRINNSLKYEGIKVLDFRGEEIKFKVLNKEEKIDYEYNAPNPKLTKGICEHLSKQLTKAQIRRSRVIKKDSIKDSEKSGQPDKVLV